MTDEPQRTLASQVRDIIAGECDIHVGAFAGFGDETELDALPGFDSPSRWEISLHLDTAFGLDLGDGEIESWNTLADVIRSVEKTKGGP